MVNGLFNMDVGNMKVLQTVSNQAFPSYVNNYGLTKREYFAAKAMQGICSDGIAGPHHSFQQTAKDAVVYADALIKALAEMEEG